MGFATAVCLANVNLWFVLWLWGLCGFMCVGCPGAETSLKTGPVLCNVKAEYGSSQDTDC